MTWLTRDAHAGVGQIDTTGTIDERYRQYRTSAAGAATELRDPPYQKLLIDLGGSVQLNCRGQRPVVCRSGRIKQQFQLNGPVENWYQNE